jgi:hypothetical protein
MIIGNELESDPSISYDQSESHNYDRLKSTRHQNNFKTKNLKRGFSPPIKITESQKRNFLKSEQEEMDATTKMESQREDKSDKEFLEETVQMKDLNEIDEDDQVIVS